MDFNFLPDREDAIPVIAGWYFTEWGDRAGEETVEETRLKLRTYLNRDRIPLLVLAAEGDKILGIAQLKFREMDIYPDRKHWLGGVFVPRPHRGKGVATRLVTKMVEIARSLGIATLYLQTEQLDGGLYARLGWDPLEQVNYKGIRVLVMKRDLGE